MTDKLYTYDYTVNPRVIGAGPDDGQVYGPRKFFNAVNFAYEDDDSRVLQSRPTGGLKAGPFDWIEEEFGDGGGSSQSPAEAAEQARKERTAARLQEAKDAAESCVISYPELPSDLGRITKIKITSSGATSFGFPSNRDGDDPSYRIPITVRQRYALVPAIGQLVPAVNLYDVNSSVSARPYRWMHGQERDELDEYGFAVQWTAYTGMKQINTAQMMENVASENGVTFARPFKFFTRYLESERYFAFHNHAEHMPEPGTFELSIYDSDDGVKFLPSQVINDVLSYLEVVNYDNENKHQFTMEIGYQTGLNGVVDDTHTIDMGER